MTRPTKEVDWNKVEEMMIYGMKGTDIAAYYGMHPNTFYNKVEEEYKMSFSEFWQQMAMIGNERLQKTQFGVAVDDKNVTMLIWLGKQRLNQREPEPKITEAQHQCAFNSWAVEQAKSKEKLDPK